MSDLANFDTAPSAQLACPECQHTIVYYDVKGSEYYVCSRCHSYFRYENENPPQVLGRYKGEQPTDLRLLPVGTPGILAGQACRVVGYVRRAEAKHTQYQWTEYQVFRPATNDYVQLSQFNGHWMVVWLAKADRELPDGRNETFQLNRFKLYNKYQARVLFAEGEFDWDIEDDDKVTVQEFIRPPYMLVKEQRGKEVTWYRAEHLEPSAVATAFGLNTSDLPRRKGMGAVQPNPLDAGWSGLRTITLFALLFLMLAQSWQGFTHPSKEVLHQTLTVEADPTAAPGANKVIVSPSFTLDQQSAVEVELRTSLNNQWLELPVSLVNEQTGQGFEFTKNIEFYSGVEDGEHWTEGSRDANAVLSRVPAGRYHLNFYPFTENGAAPEITATVTTNPTLWSNFFMVLGLVLIYPAFLLFHSASQERLRWAESDYNPYQTD